MSTIVNASCFCDLNSFSVAFNTASLPIANDLCHCSTCRHSSGQMAVCYVSIQGVPMTKNHGNGSRNLSHVLLNTFDKARGRGTGTLSEIAAPIEIKVTEEDIPYDLGDLTAYKTSPAVTRYFCHSCSAQLFRVHHANPGPDRWAVAVGSLQKTEAIVKVGYHIWIGDTLDGGIANHLRALDGVQLPRFKGEVGSELLAMEWKSQSILDPQSKQKQEQLKAFCHCRAISFTITKPSVASFSPSAAYPDLLHPYDVSHMYKISNPDDEKWWLQPSASPIKYLAGHCMCKNCRLSSGFEVQSWMFIPLSNLAMPNRKAMILQDEEQRPKGLKQYISSPGRYREFCGTCGATSFLWHADVPNLVNVSVGLLDEKDGGARAENWLHWHRDRVSFAEKALSPSVAKALEEVCCA